MPELRHQTMQAQIERVVEEHMHQEREGVKAPPTKRKGSRCIDCLHAWLTDFEGCDACEGLSNFIFWEPESQ